MDQSIYPLRWASSMQIELAINNGIVAIHTIKWSTSRWNEWPLHPLSTSWKMLLFRFSSIRFQSGEFKAKIETSILGWSYQPESLSRTDRPTRKWLFMSRQQKQRQKLDCWKANPTSKPKQFYSPRFFAPFAVGSFYASGSIRIALKHKHFSHIFCCCWLQLILAASFASVWR